MPAIDAEVGIPLAVCLNGGRPYVQGSQMLAAAAEHARQRLGAHTLMACSFRRITDCGVVLRWDGGENPATIGSARFAGERDAVTMFFDETDQAAPQATLPEPVVLERGADASRVGFREADGFFGLMTVIVQSIKALHEQLAGDARDLWFTGLRAASLPLVPDGFRAGEVELSIDRLVGAAPTFQTLTMVGIRGEHDTIRFPVTFAFKADRAPDVA